jgi:hypothetical protein
MSAAEFLEWVWLQQYEPLPDPWLASGTVAATVANVNRGKGSRAMKPSDFVPAKTEPLRPAEAGDQSAAFAAFKADFAGVRQSARSE